MRTPAPLTRSVTKAKGELPHGTQELTADRPPPPQFGQLQNAFARTPATSRKRQRTEAPLSPSSTPRKAQPYSSPVVSPVRSQGGHVPADGDVSMDWQPDFGGFDAGPNAGSATVILADRDTKTEVRSEALQC